MKILFICPAEVRILNGASHFLTFPFYLKIIRTERNVRIPFYLLILSEGSVRLKKEPSLQHNYAHHSGGHQVMQRG